MNKKGQGLTLNTVIIAILVVLVLVVVAAFFLGGTKGLTDSIKRVFFQTTTGTDQTIAIETCKQRCDQIDTLVSVIPGDPTTDDYKKAYVITVDKSAFCSQSFSIDRDSNGNADTDSAGKPINYYCNMGTSSVSLGVQCKHTCTPLS